MSQADWICEWEDFSLAFPVMRQGARVWVPAVNQIHMGLRPGEITALIGESGCGKTVTALSLAGLCAELARQSGHLRFQGRELLGLSEREWQALRGDRISMIFQEPMTALNPLIPVGKQIAEAYAMHCGDREERKKKREKALEQMRLAGLPDVERLYRQYPHQLSGGQRQRIMIAMALINEPEILIADEPTTALDVTIQAQIMELIRTLNRERHTAVLLISHDLGVVRRLCSQLFIMYAGRIVESGEVEEVFHHPKHPYTIGLLAAQPSYEKRGKELETIPGTVPALEERSQEGCPYVNRCIHAQKLCEQSWPQARQVGDRAHWFCCHEAEKKEKEDGNGKR